MTKLVPRTRLFAKRLDNDGLELLYDIRQGLRSLINLMFRQSDFPDVRAILSDP